MFVVGTICSDLAYDDHSNFMHRKSFEQMVCFYAYVRAVYVLFAYSAPAQFICHPIYFHEISLLNSIKHQISTKSEVFFVSFADEADSGDDHSDRGRSHTPEQQNHHQEERPLALNLVSFSFANIITE